MKVKLKDDFLVTGRGVVFRRGEVEIPDGIILPTGSKVQDASGEWIDGSRYRTGDPLPGGGPVPEPEPEPEAETED